MNNDELAKIIKEVAAEILSENNGTKVAAQNVQNFTSNTSVVCDGEVPDLSLVDYRARVDVPNAANMREYLDIRSKTDARLGVWRAGPRLCTNTYLRFRADHATAMDAVFQDVPSEYLQKLGLKEYSTKCKSKDDFLTRPDLGREFDDETLAQIKADCGTNMQVQVYVSDGLSSSSVVANAEDILPAIMQGLKMHNISVGKPFYVKYGRVGAEDVIAQALNAQVTVVLLGERPGLASGESMSAYMVYKGYPGIAEAKRTVVSNIHKKGTNPVEAGAAIAELCVKMLKEKASGLDLTR